MTASFLWIFYTEESSFLRANGIIHISIYIPTSILLVMIHLLFVPGILWSVIAMAGWDIGLGLHILLATYTTCISVNPKRVKSSKLFYFFSKCFIAEKL